ncbi:DUF2533 family protein [Peribacillus cavernae]|uniref:DUF2533 family protein n=1 Tax=Peribacillus cavernae TaxID=1674310 RepID=A0A433HS56_9BACI|nr:DUF2533 family protein [Peribacillus cavernae]MDQ0220634.1 hypothetical protein [Peribacillus cavernae]RUQ31094.1 DUF2533 family protein [Peribacillus cavernae]
MSVHKDLAIHARKQNEIYNHFLSLDQERENYIEQTVALCKQGRPFTTDKINEITNEMNRLPKLRIIPNRRNVTADMIEEYVKTL